VKKTILPPPLPRPSPVNPPAFVTREDWVDVMILGFVMGVLIALAMLARVRGA
jgi:hypothetical protein